MKEENGKRGEGDELEVFLEDPLLPGDERLLVLQILPLVLNRASEAAVLSLDKQRAHLALGLRQLQVSMSVSDDCLLFLPPTTELLPPPPPLLVVDPAVPPVVEGGCDRDGGLERGD